MSAQDTKFVYWFSELGKENIPIAGGKGANLGEMTRIGIPVPPGFVVSVSAYAHFIAENKLLDQIREYLTHTDKSRPETYSEVSQNIIKLLKKSPIPREITNEVTKAYFKLGGLFHNPLVAVRSSATAEDLPDASFAGQQRTFLNIKGETELMNSIKECWASLFEARAIFYREEKKFDHFKVGLAIPVQKMIQSVSSGVMFTCDPVSGEKNRLIIEAVYGLGELIVQGEVTPDHFVVSKESSTIVQKIISTQKIELARVGTITKKYYIPTKKQNRPKISDQEVLKLAKLGTTLQNHYFFPQDIEWAIDKKRHIFIVQTRPVTTLHQGEAKPTNPEFASAEKQIDLKKEILSGASASPGIGWGPVVLVNSKREIGKVKSGDILVTSMTTPDFVPAMKKVSAIVTDRGGQTSHAAIVSRELGVPCVVGTLTATKILKSGQVITVDGTLGKVYQGGLKTKSHLIETPQLAATTLERRLLKTATKIYVNLADASLADETAKLNCDGVGLLRAEFMMADLGVHPKKVLADGKEKAYIEKLAEKMASFCRAFNPRPVVYRATDFKTNEYRSLNGGELYEPKERNPMLGFRGAYRYIVDEKVFALEIEAIKRVRNFYGFKNLWLMIPFVRTPQELAQVKKIIAGNGLMRSPSFKLWMMAEIPSNVIQLDEFIDVGIDGISIGSNDLTMMVLGTDRDNEAVASEFSELNPSVLWCLEKIITTCHKRKITCSICGQGPSEHADLVTKLVSYGITSISANPDVVDRTRELVYQAEASLVTKAKN